MTNDDAKDEALRMLRKWRPKPVQRGDYAAYVHTCRHPPGSLRVIFTWRWPFIHIWRSRAICLCEINAILDECQAEPVQARGTPGGHAEAE